MLQVWPPSLNAAFWRHHTRAQLQQADLNQSIPSLFFDVAGFERCRASACIVALSYALKAVRMWPLLTVLRQPGQHSSAYSPARRNTLILAERLLRTWALAHVATVFDQHEWKPAALGGPAAGTWQHELFWACRVLVLGSGAFAAFWHSRFMSLPWRQEALLLSILLRVSLHWRLKVTAAIFSSWRPGGSTHYLHLGKLVVRAVGSASCRLVSAAGQRPPARLVCAQPRCPAAVHAACWMSAQLRWAPCVRQPAGRSATQPTQLSHTANQPTSQPASSAPLQPRRRSPPSTPQTRPAAASCSPQTPRWPRPCTSSWCCCCRCSAGGRQRGALLLAAASCCH
jgi:hypothetical protein